MRKAGLALGILAVLIVAGLVTAPYFLDLSYLKVEIASLVRARTGQTLVIDGPLRLRLLPTPTIGARDLHIANPAGAPAPDLVRLRAVEVKLDFLPLLAGRIVVRSARLVAPEFDLERRADGSVAWQGSAAKGGASPEGWAIRNLAIEDGTVTLRGDRGIERVEHIDAGIVIDGGDTALQAQGGFILRGLSLRFTASAGRLEQGQAPLSATLTARPDGRLQFDGMVSGTLGAPHLKGKVALTAKDAGALAGMVVRLKLPAAFAQPLDIAGGLDLASGTAALDQAVVAIGDAHAAGHLAVSWGGAPSFDLALALDRLNLDRWADAAPPAPRREAAVPPPDAIAAIPLVRDAAGGGFTLPDRWRGKIALGVDALIWRGDLVQQAKLRASVARGRVVLDQAGALLPGGTTLTLTGGTSLAGGSANFDGHLAVQSDNLRALVGWAGVNVAAVAPDRLRRAAAAVDLRLAGEQLELRNLDLSLDATRATGAAVVALRQRLGVGLRLVVDRINLDAYLPQANAAPAAGSMPAAIDANVDLGVGELTWRGEPLRKLQFTGSLQAGKLSVQALTVGDLGGATAQIVGTVEGLGGDAATGQLAFDAKGPAFERVLRFLPGGNSLGQSLGVFTLGGTVQVGGKGDLTLDSDLQVLGGRAHVVGDIAGAHGVNLTLEASHPSIAGLLGNFWPSSRPAATSSSAAKLSLQLAGKDGHFTLDRLALGIGESSVIGKITIGLDGPQTQIAAALAIDAVPRDVPPQADGIGALGGKMTLAATLAATGGTVRDLVASLTGSAQVTGLEGELRGIGLKGGAAKDGTTRFSAPLLSFRVAGGVARSDHTQVSTEAGMGRGAVAIDLPNWAIDGSLAFRADTAPDAAPFVLRLQGALDQPRETMESPAEGAGSAPDGSAAGPSSPLR